MQTSASHNTRLLKLCFLKSENKDDPKNDFLPPYHGVTWYFLNIHGTFVFNILSQHFICHLYLGQVFQLRDSCQLDVERVDDKHSEYIKDIDEKPGDEHEDVVSKDDIIDDTKNTLEHSMPSLTDYLYPQTTRISLYSLFTNIDKSIFLISFIFKSFSILLFYLAVLYLPKESRAKKWI